jgi:hypothetical protein
MGKVANNKQAAHHLGFVLLCVVAQWTGSGGFLTTTTTVRTTSSSSIAVARNKHGINHGALLKNRCCLLKATGGSDDE